MASLKGSFVSYLSIKPNYCADFSLYIPSPEEAYDRKRPEKNSPNFEMSRASRGRLMSAINWMVLFSPRKFVYRKPPKKSFYFKVNFITLTLSDAQFHDDDYIKTHMLEPFLKWMKRSHNAINYVWRAETQENGNIHFHITTNKYIWIKSIQNKWNSLQKNHGYIKRFFEIHGHHDAPSTDVKAVKNTKELAVYLGKYFAKDRPTKAHKNLMERDRFPTTAHFELCAMALGTHPGDILRRGVDGKQWACSTSLTKLRLSINESDTNYWEERRMWLEMYGREKRESDYADIYITKWTMDNKAPEGIAKKIMTLYNRFNSQDDGVMKYREPGT